MSSQVASLVFMASVSLRLSFRRHLYRCGNFYRFNSAQRRTFSCSASRLDCFTVQDKDDFQNKVINSTAPVLVDFYADWCGPCQILTPRLESAVIQRDPNVHLAKVNVDNLADIAMDYDVSAVPHVVALKKGEILGRFVGLRDEDQIEEFLNRIVKLP